MPWVLTNVYQYVAEKYNVVPDAPGIRKPNDPLLEGETDEPVLEMLPDVIVEKIVLYTRADFPHDNYWVNGCLEFSDQSTMELPMEKSVAPHVFPVDAKVTRSITLKDLIKSGEESPFPALTQIEVYGRVRDVGEAFSQKTR